VELALDQLEAALDVLLGVHQAPSSCSGSIV